jgi:Fe-S-cluster containining protein
MRECTRCGKCCEIYGDALGCVTDVDLDLWAERPDILRWVGGGDLWVNPVTHEEACGCPWLSKQPNRRGSCRIYEHRPEICREYPVNVTQMIDDGCEMLEPGDLDKPKEQLLAELARLTSR